MLWALVVTSLLGAAPTVELHTLDGRTVRGSVAEFSTASIVVTTDSGQVALEAGGLLDVVPQPTSTAAPSESAGPCHIDLVDGSSIVAREYAIDGGDATLTLADGGAMHLPHDAIRAVRFAEQTEPVAAQWSTIVSAPQAADLIVVRKDEALDYLEGVLGRVTAETVEFKLDDELIPVGRGKVEGIVYYHGKRELPASVCVVADRDGSTAEAREVHLDGERLRIVSAAGATIDWPWASVARIDFSKGKLVYLSDLEPESFTWSPYFGTAADQPALAGFLRWRADRGFASPTLRVGGIAYSKGIALHSRSELTFRLTGRFRTLQATAGIDDAAGKGGNVELVIQGDDRELLRTTVAGGQAPIPIELDVAGVERLKIVVDFGDDLDVADHLDLCEAKVLQ